MSTTTWGQPMVLVQALTGEHDGRRSFTVLGADALPIGAVEHFLRYSVALGYSPNTIKAYSPGWV